MNAPNTEFLIYRSPIDSLAYMQLFRQLMPRGRPWHFPIDREDVIRPFGIPSIEGIGRPTLSAGNAIITLIGISTGETFGSPGLGLVIEPTGIGSAETFGSPSVFLAQAITTPTGIVTGEAFGTAFAVTQALAGCSFDNDICPGIFDSEFYVDWGYQTENGQGIGQSPIATVDRFYPPTGDLLTGDFLILLGLWASTTETGNASTGLNIHDSGAVQKLNFWYGEGAIKEDIQDAIEAVSTGPIEHFIKIERISGSIWIYVWTGSAWLRMDAWDTPKNAISFSADFYIDANGGDGINGFTRFYIEGALA